MVLPEGQGSGGNFTITVTSLGGYAGNITLSTKVEDFYRPMPLELSPTRLSISPSFPSAFARLSFAWTACIESCLNYATIIINATDGSMFHFASTGVVFTSFFLSISSTPYCGDTSCDRCPLQLAPNSTTSCYVRLATPDEYTGNVTLTVAVAPSGPAVSLNSSRAQISRNRWPYSRSVSGPVNLTISSNNAPSGSYNVTVVGTDGYSTYTADLDLEIASPASPNEFNVPLLLFVGGSVAAAAAVSTLVYRRWAHSKDQYSDLQQSGWASEFGTETVRKGATRRRRSETDYP